MAFYSPYLDKLRTLSPGNLRRLSNERLSDLVEKEAVRSRARVDDLVARFPAASQKELSQRLIDTKKQLAGLVGGVTGVFGAVTVPLDLAGMVYLQLSLLVDIATVHKVNLKSERSRQELLDLFGYANGIGPVQRSSPKVLGSLAGLLLTRGGLKTLGRAMPFVAAPISAYLNNQHVQAVGEAAVRHYDGWVHAHEKTQKASGA